MTGGKQYKVLRIYVCYEYTAQQVKLPDDVCMEQAVLFRAGSVNDLTHVREGDFRELHFSR